MQNNMVKMIIVLNDIATMIVELNYINVYLHSQSSCPR